MYRKLLAGLLGMFTLVVVNAQEKASYFKKADTFFNTYVSEGRVDYDAIVEHKNELLELLDLAKSIELETSNASDYQAFWINSYNLLVIKSVVENHPLKSPLDKAGFFDKTKHEVGGINITLNDIENKLLRANFPNEPRFHFVLVCAGLGCPPIIDKAYLPETLEMQLEQQTLKALNDPNFIRVNKNKVKISQIFEWYKGDFTKDGSLVDFINKYKSEKLPENSKVSYYAYDWTLNGTK